MSILPYSAFRLLPVLLNRSRGRQRPPPPPHTALFRPFLALSFLSTAVSPAPPSTASPPPRTPLESSLSSLRDSLPTFPYPPPSQLIAPSLDRALHDLRYLLAETLTPPSATTVALAPALAALASHQHSAAARAFSYVHAALTSTSSARGAILSRLVSARRAASEASLSAALARPGIGVRERYDLMWEARRAKREGLRVLAGVCGRGVGRWVAGGLGVPHAVIELARGFGEGGETGKALRETFGAEAGELVEGAKVVREAVRWVEGGEGDGEDVVERVCEVLGEEVLGFVERLDVGIREVERQRLKEVGLWEAMGVAVEDCKGSIGSVGIEG